MAMLGNVSVTTSASALDRQTWIQEQVHMASNFDVDTVRAKFPALKKKQIYFDNAGGSQVLQSVIDSVADYLSNNNVQLGASYPVSATSTALYDAGCTSVATYINASPSEVVLGPSTTQLFRNLSLSLYDHVTPGSEIIVSLLDHEANIASWIQLAKWRDATIKWWGHHDADNPQLDCNDLRALMSEKTKLVACTHTSNILGTINDIKAIAKTVHEVEGAFLCVDAVAYAPHRAIDVKDLEVDFYSFSWYKVYGPHIASLYASAEAQKRLLTLGHFFKDSSTLENMLGLAAANYELTASIPKVAEYLKELSWDAIAEYEERLQAILIGYLNSKPDVFQIKGEPVSDRAKRVPVISFVVKGRSSKSIIDAIEAKSDVGARWGSFYSNRLIKEVLGLDPADGVVRASLCHYNTEAEMQLFVKLLDEAVNS